MEETIKVHLSISRELAENIIRRDKGAELALIQEIRNAVGILIKQKEDTK